MHLRGVSNSPERLAAPWATLLALLTLLTSSFAFSPFSPFSQSSRNPSLPLASHPLLPPLPPPNPLPHPPPPTLPPPPLPKKKILKRQRSTQKRARSTGTVRVWVEWPTDPVEKISRRRSRVSCTVKPNRKESIASRSSGKCKSASGNTLISTATVSSDHSVYLDKVETDICGFVRLRCGGS